MTNPKDSYEDPVNRTFRLYGPQIKEAYNELGEENPNFSVIEFSKGKYVHAKVSADGTRGASFHDLKKLESKVRELTGDSKVKLIRNISEWQRELRRKYMEWQIGAGKIAGLSSSSEKVQLKIDDKFSKSPEWLDKDFRRK